MRARARARRAFAYTARHSSRHSSASAARASAAPLAAAPAAAWACCAARVSRSKAATSSSCAQGSGEAGPRGGRGWRNPHCQLGLPWAGGAAQRCAAGRGGARRPPLHPAARAPAPTWPQPCCQHPGGPPVRGGRPRAWAVAMIPSSRLHRRLAGTLPSPAAQPFGSMHPGSVGSPQPTPYPPPPPLPSPTRTVKRMQTSHEPWHRLTASWPTWLLSVRSVSSWRSARRSSRVMPPPAVALLLRSSSAQQAVVVCVSGWRVFFLGGGVPDSLKRGGVGQDWQVVDSCSGYGWKFENEVETSSQAARPGQRGGPPAT